MFHSKKFHAHKKIFPFVCTEHFFFQLKQSKKSFFGYFSEPNIFYRTHQEKREGERERESLVARDLVHNGKATKQKSKRNKHTTLIKRKEKRVKQIGRKPKVQVS